MDEVDKIECEVCGWLVEIPLYCNVGRYIPMFVWCRNCNQGYKYWRFFGCQTFPETEGWQPFKKRKILEKD